jgi:hypothetical protein
MKITLFRYNKNGTGFYIKYDYWGQFWIYKYIKVRAIKYKYIIEGLGF